MSLKALASKYGPAALGTYTVVTTTFFTTIYATLSAGYDATPLVLGVVDKAAAAGVDVKPWMRSVELLDDDDNPSPKMPRGSTFVSALLIAKLFVPIKVPLTAALTPTVAKAAQRYLRR